MRTFTAGQDRWLSTSRFFLTVPLWADGRSLLELARELIDDHWCVVSAVCPDQGPLVEELAKIGAATLVVGYHRWCGPAADETTMREWLIRDLRTIGPQMSGSFGV